MYLEGQLDSITTNMIEDEAITGNKISSDTIGISKVVLSDFDSRYVNKAGDTMSGVLSMGNSKITNVAEPTNNQDVATKNYVDSNSGGGVSGTNCNWTDWNVYCSGSNDVALRSISCPVGKAVTRVDTRFIRRVYDSYLDSIYCSSSTTLSTIITSSNSLTSTRYYCCE